MDVRPIAFLRHMTAQQDQSDDFWHGVHLRKKRMAEAESPST
jgi:hypothetical protein